MFLTSALEIMLQLYKEYYCSVLKEKWKDHDLCLGLLFCLFLSLFCWVLSLFLFLFIPTHSAPLLPPLINMDICMHLGLGKCVAVGRSEL